MHSYQTLVAFFMRSVWVHEILLWAYKSAPSILSYTSSFDFILKFDHSS
jgi:hypothetical protein